MVSIEVTFPELFILERVFQLAGGGGPADSSAVFDSGAVQPRSVSPGLVGLQAHLSHAMREGSLLSSARDL